MTSHVPSPSPAPQPQAWPAQTDPAVQPDSHADASHPQATAHPAPAGQGPAGVVPPPGTDLASDLGAALRFAGNALLRNIPGLIASVLLFFAIPASARGASPVEAIKQSVALVRANLGTTIVAWLVLSVVGSAAGMFVLPIIVTIPFYVLFQLGMFERLQGRELPDPARA